MNLVSGCFIIYDDISIEGMATWMMIIVMMKRIGFIGIMRSGRYSYDSGFVVKSLAGKREN